MLMWTAIPGWRKIGCKEKTGLWRLETEMYKIIEKEYKVTIDEDDLMPENFDTMEAIENYVQSQLDK